jgi:ribosomal protein L16 Arg81 hydroxylase
VKSFEFSNLFKKISRRDFIEKYHDKQAYFEAGAISDVCEIFSWSELNDLFNRPKLWNGEMMELAINGKVLPPPQYGRPGMGRLGERVLRPDREKVNHFLRQGATLVLDYLEGIHPDIQRVATCIERLTGTLVSCNAYCSWQSVQGYASHFDTMCVFALQIEGEKTWNIYDGRVNEPMAIPGARPADFSREQHDRQKGRVAREVVMRPGDVLYLPRGLYHDALATDTASLHLSFGATYLAGFSALSLLMGELQREEFFRQRLPHFDDREALSGYLREVGEKVAERVADTGFHGRVTDHMLRNLGDKVTGNRLPDRGEDRFYLVTRREPRLVRRGPSWRLEAGSDTLEVAPDLVDAVRHMIQAESFWISELSGNFDPAGDMARELLTALEDLGVIFPVAV